MAGWVACEGVDGDSVAAEVEATWVSSDDVISVRYAAPPWEVVTETEDTLELQIVSMLFGVELDGAPPTHAFRIQYVDAPDELDDLIDAVESIDGLDVDPGTLPEDIPGEVEDTLPSYLQDIDLTAPREVALAELRHLVETQNAQLDEPLVALEGASQDAVSYQVVLDPGVYVRGFYFSSPDRAVRAMFASAFDLTTEDIEIMARSIRTTGTR